MEPLFNRIRYTVSNVCCMCIRIYQLVLSPCLGPHCRFEPSCSTYTYQAIQYYGPLKGIGLGLIRLMRCHPGTPSGYHPLLPPYKKENQ